MTWSVARSLCDSWVCCFFSNYTCKLLCAKFARFVRSMELTWIIYPTTHAQLNSSSMTPCEPSQLSWETRNTICRTWNLSNATFFYFWSRDVHPVQNLLLCTFHENGWFLPCDAMHSAAIACMRCLSVRLSVTFVSCAKTNKDIFEIFPPSGSHTILVFPYQTGWRYSNGNPPNGGVECKGRMTKLTIFD